MVSNRDQRFIEIAADQASRSQCLMRHGCVAVMNGRIIGRGFNNYRCHSNDGFIQNTMTCHAEIAALREVNKRGKKTRKITLYVVRLDSNNTLKASAPCVDCMKRINMMGVKRVIHSTNTGTIVIQNPNICVNHITTGRRILMGE
jgi:deoxycytidylate deaminase